MGLKGRMIDCLRVEGILKDNVTLFEGRLHIPKFLAHDGRDVIRHLIVDYRGSFLDGIQRVEDRRQLLIVHLDEF